MMMTMMNKFIFLMLSINLEYSYFIITRFQYIISSPAIPLCACASPSPRSSAPLPSPTHHISSNFANRKQEISPNYDNSQNRFAYTIWINWIWIYVSHQAHCWRDEMNGWEKIVQFCKVHNCVAKFYANLTWSHKSSEMRAQLENSPEKTAINLRWVIATRDNPGTD